MSEFFNITKRRIQGKKTVIFAVTLILLLTASSFFAVFTLPFAHAQAAPGKLVVPMYDYISAFPTPVGVGQTINIFAWLDNFPPTANGLNGDRWNNITINIMKPDGSNQTLGHLTSDPVGTVFETFVPETTGNYSFQMIFTGQLLAGNNLNPTQVATAQAYATAHSVSLATAEAIYVTGYTYIGNYYTAAISNVATVTVQSAPIAGPPDYPLPNEYWSTPVSQSGHQRWAYIMGDWLSFSQPGNYINDYTAPPLTPHIDWNTPIAGYVGGVAGNTVAIASGGDNYYTGLSYEGMFGTAIIMNGQLYYNIGNPPIYGFVDVDLTTGKQVWYQNGTTGTNIPLPLNAITAAASSDRQAFPGLSFGQELDYESPNQHGTIPILWSVYTAANTSNVWAMYDARSGNWICNLWNVPVISSNAALDSFGDIMIYTAHFGGTNYMSVWNSTQLLLDQYPNLYPNNGNWIYRPPVGQNIDGTGNYATPLTGPVGQVTGTRVATPAGAPVFGTGNTNYTITGQLPPNAASFSILGIDQTNQLAIYSNIPTTGPTSYPTPASYSSFAISISPDSLGKVMWSKTYNWPAGNITLETKSANFIGNGVFAWFWKETTTWTGYSTTTGDLLWTTSKPEIANHMFGVSGGIYNGVLYSGDSSGTGGNVYAYNVTNGGLIFDYQAPSFGYNGYWINIPTSITEFAAGNVYTYGSEHSPGPNLEPGEQLGDINATTGASIWNITFWGSGVKIADNYLVALNLYDNQIYAFSKGPTRTTVETPLTSILPGQSIVIQGLETDVSPGTTQTNVALRFPNGVAAVSDDSMRTWMEYVYMQNPFPSNDTGVPVDITILDPNNNIINLPSTTSDTSGHYSLTYTAPNVPGTYKVIATFHGTNGYWPSYAESSFVVGSSSQATVTPTPSPPSMADTYFLPVSALIIIVIVIIGIAIMLMLRKRP